MPSRNTVKMFASESFYHVYNRGAGGQKIFMDSADKRKFMKLFRRHLLDAEKPEVYKQYDVEVTAYFFIPKDTQIQLADKSMRSFIIC